jgi:hypothetical protein
VAGLPHDEQPVIDKSWSTVNWNQWTATRYEANGVGDSQPFNYIRHRLWRFTAASKHSIIMIYANICIDSREILNHFTVSSNKCRNKHHTILSGYFTMLSVSKLYSVSNRMINECGAVGGTRIGRGYEITWRKPTSVPLRPLQILCELPWNWTRFSAVASQRLTAWTMAVPLYYQVHSSKYNFSFENSHLLIATKKIPCLNINSKLFVLNPPCYGDLNRITDNTL